MSGLSLLMRVFSLYFWGYQGIYGRDGFAQDCLHRHQVLVFIDISNEIRTLGTFPRVMRGFGVLPGSKDDVLYSVYR